MTGQAWSLSVCHLWVGGMGLDPLGLFCAAIVGITRPMIP